jgi:hypothetical protein
MLNESLVAIRNLQLAAVSNPAAHFKDSIHVAACYLTFCTPQLCQHMRNESADSSNHCLATRSWNPKEATTIQHAAAEVLASLLASAPLLPARLHFLQYAAEFVAHINIISACAECSHWLWGHAGILPGAISHILRLALPLSTPAHPTPTTSLPTMALQGFFHPLLQLFVVDTSPSEVVERMDAKFLNNLHAVAKVLCTWFFVSEWLPMWSSLRPMFNALLTDVLLPHFHASLPFRTTVKHERKPPTRHDPSYGTNSQHLCGRKRARPEEVLVSAATTEGETHIHEARVMIRDRYAPLCAVTAALARACHTPCSPLMQCETCVLASCVPSSLPSSQGFYTQLLRNVTAAFGKRQQLPTPSVCVDKPNTKGMVEPPALHSHVLHRVFEFLQPTLPSTSRSNAASTILQSIQTYHPLMCVNTCWRDAIQGWTWWNTVATCVRVIPHTTDMTTIHTRTSHNHMTVICECGGCAHEGASRHVLTRLASQFSRATRLTRAAATRLSQLCGRTSKGGISKPRMCAFCGCDAVFVDTPSLKHHIHAVHGVLIRQVPAYCKLC